MPAYEGEDHWVYSTDAVLRPWVYERMIRNLGRNLAIAGALCAAFQYGFNFAYWNGGWEDGKGVPHPKISILQG